MLSHDRPKLRRFIQNTFNDEELGNFCFDYFPQVYNEFTTGMPKSQKARMLVERAESGNRLHDLHAALERENPLAYGNAFLEGDIPIRHISQQSNIRNSRQIFISHASADAGFAHRLAADIRLHGWQTWIAPESIRPGEKWVEAINRGLAECGVFVLVLTEASVNSRWVQTETNAAIGMENRGELRFIPISLEEVDTPPLWQSYQWLPFHREYEAELTTLLEELDTQSNRNMELSKPLQLPVKKPIKPETIEERVSSWLSQLSLNVWVGVILALVVMIGWVAWYFDGINIANVPSESGPIEGENLNLPPLDAELGDTWTRQKDDMVMVYVPPPDLPFVLESGTSAPTEGYWIDRYEVSNAQYQQCVNVGVCRPLLYLDDEPFQGDDYPVVGVSAFDADAYSAWVGGVLPTEAEWEYAVVGDAGTHYPWGDEFDGARLNFCDANCKLDWRGETWDDGYQYTAPVNSFLNSRSWVGALNMVGNVWEWTASWREGRENERVLRGGSWDAEDYGTRSDLRNSALPGYSNYGIGFRVVMHHFPNP